MNGKIYALCDPGTGEVRYVGQTWRDPDVRLRQHRGCARNPRLAHYHVHRWMNTLGRSPTILVLKEGFRKQSTLDRAEVRFIAAYRKDGARLTNMELGGRGGIPNEEIRRRHSIRAKKVMNKPEQKERLKRETKERFHNPLEKERIKRETKERWNALSDEEKRERVQRASAGVDRKAHAVTTKLALTGRPRSPETRAKISASLKSSAKLQASLRAMWLPGGRRYHERVNARG